MKSSGEVLNSDGFETSYAKSKNGRLHSNL